MRQSLALIMSILTAAPMVLANGKSPEKDQPFSFCGIVMKTGFTDLAPRVLSLQRQGLQHIGETVFYQGFTQSELSGLILTGQIPPYAPNTPLDDRISLIENDNVFAYAHVTSAATPLNLSTNYSTNADNEKFKQEARAVAAQKSLIEAFVGKLLAKSAKAAMPKHLRALQSLALEVFALGRQNYSTASHFSLKFNEIEEVLSRWNNNESPPQAADEDEEDSLTLGDFVADNNLRYLLSLLGMNYAHVMNDKSTAHKDFLALFAGLPLESGYILGFNRSALSKLNSRDQDHGARLIAPIDINNITGIEPLSISSEDFLNQFYRIQK